MSKRPTFSPDDVQRAVRKIGVLRVAQWFLIITLPIILSLSASFQFIPANPLYLRAVVGLCGISVGLGLFIWKFIRMAQEDDV